MRAAIIHYWLLKMRGGEKVIEALCRLLPDADIFTLFYDPERISPEIGKHRVTTSFLDRYRRHYKSLLPLMPMALEHFDLRGYDLVVSSESGPAKGVLTQTSTRHVCYCHSPLRYLWDEYPAYLHDWTKSAWKRALVAPVASYLRTWDYASAARVDSFVANSENTSRKLHKIYRRESSVVHPPVAVETFYTKPPGDYYLAVTELLPYKRIDVAVRVFAQTGRRLKVVGEGPLFGDLKRLAGRNIEFCGWAPDAELRELYANCRALVHPGEEDFGMAPVEAMASGKPVIALGRGGVCETVPLRDPLGGVLYTDSADAGLAEALERFERIEGEIDPPALQRYAARFSEAAFQDRMKKILFP